MQRPPEFRAGSAGIMASQEGLKKHNGLSSDARWQLVERVISSSAFQRSNRLRDLFTYIAERTIRGEVSELTEQHIGQVVFGKPAGYSPNEDSSVRVHARQLRLKLHEYFDGDGRGEPLIVEIPKGTYVPVFRQAHAGFENPAPTVSPQIAEKKRPGLLAVLPWLIAAGTTAFSIFLLLHPVTKVAPLAPSPWPLSAVFNRDHHTQIVVADINYGMLQFISQKQGSLEDYLVPDFQKAFDIPHPTPREARTLSFLNKTLHTSYADVAVVARLMTVVGDSRRQVLVRSARDLSLRELEEGNYVLLGSPVSNPWVSLFQGRLNFEEHPPVNGGTAKCFLNKSPKANEQSSYEGLPRSGVGGEDYATIALLPNGKRGSVLILQGLHQEGTEGAGLFLGEPENRLQLRRALGIRDGIEPAVYFEALLSTSVVAGAPAATKIVATRLLP